MNTTPRRSIFDTDANRQAIRERHAELAEEVTTMLAQIKKFVQKARKNDHLDWADVGDIGHIREELAELVEGLPE